MFLFCASEGFNFNNEIHFSETKIIIYIIVTIMLLISSVILCFFYDTYDALFAAVSNILIAIIYFGFSWTQEELGYFVDNETIIEDNLKNFSYIMLELQDINYMLSKLNINSGLSQYFQNPLNNTDLPFILNQLNNIKIFINSLNFNDDLLLINKNKIINNISCLSDIIKNNQQMKSFFPFEMIANGSNFITNYFLENYLNIDNIYFAIKKYNNIKKIEDTTLDLTNAETFYFNSYKCYQNTNGDIFTLVIENNDNAVKIVKQKENIMNIKIFHKNEQVESIDFINNFPIFLINNQLYLMLQDATLIMQLNDFDIYNIRDIHLSKSILLNNFYSYNKYFNQHLVLNFKNGTIQINFKNENLGVFLNSENLIS